MSLANAFPQNFDLFAMSESQRALELRKARDVFPFLKKVSVGFTLTQFTVLCAV